MSNVRTNVLNMTHFLELAKRGGHGAASSGEVRAHALALAILENVPGLGQKALNGMMTLAVVAFERPGLALEMFRAK